MNPLSDHATDLGRRTFLRHIALVGAGVALAACDGATSTPPTAVSSGAATPDAANAAITAVAPDAEPSLAVVAATFEQLVDQPNPFVFGLFTLEQEPIEDVSAQVYALPPGGGEPVGPWSAVPADTDVPPGGLYTVDADFAGTGVHEVVVVSDDGRAGSVAIDVRDTGSSQLPAPGQQAQAVPTPTTADELGYTTLCTRTPEPCGMHEISLDNALVREQPVVLLFATPAFCQTAVCGPTVDVLEELRSDFGDVQFVHCEIFSDEGATVGDPIQAWNLPTEPWLFVINPDGRIAGRADGPLLVLADEVRSLITSGTTAG
ncbi:thioredoxin family protein [soil metagenome]